MVFLLRKAEVDRLRDIFSSFLTPWNHLNTISKNYLTNNNRMIGNLISPRSGFS
jgi:hypothetical protein